MQVHSFKNSLQKVMAAFAFLFITVNFTNAQLALPQGVKHFPESLGPLADTAFYNGCLPMFSSINWDNDATGHQKMYILTISRMSSPLDTFQSVIRRVVYPTQAALLSADSLGLFPQWELNFKDDTAPEPMRRALGIFRYYPQYGIYTVMKQDPKREDRGTLLILDSTFHKIDLIPNVVANAHDFQLLKMPNGNWEFVTALAAPPKYFNEHDKNYEISGMVYDHSVFKRQLWKCGPTVKTVDSAEWYPIYNGCPALPMRAFSPHDMFHPNSWQAYNWSKDSLLVAVSEKNDDKIRFWWIVDSMGRWVTRDMFRLGRQKDKYNNFSFPADSGFQLSGGHNFRILGKYENTLLASYYDVEECDDVLPARGLILSLDIEKKICRILQQTIQGCHADGQGNMQLMVDETAPVTPGLLLNANRCMDWGGWNRFYTGVTSGYYPSGNDDMGKCWEISVMNPKSQPIVGITITDLGFYTHYQVVSNSEYQAMAWYELPIPHNPITYTIKGDSVTFTTKLVHPTWINGAKTSSITLPIGKKGRPVVSVWVRGKTDETMIGELWEHTSLPTK